jgi:ribosomal protein L37AE/L43A
MQRNHGMSGKGSYMKIRQCPRCQQQMLISTGAFWTCYACSFAITGQALSVDLGHQPDTMRNNKRHRSR